jgi:hypothetical protein
VAETVEHWRSRTPGTRTSDAPDPPGKTVPPLLVDVRRGGFLRPFRPGASDEVFLAVQQGCPYRCAYCYLHGLLKGFQPTHFLNPEALLQELHAFLALPRSRGARIHAAHLGEIAPYEPVTGLCARVSRALSLRPDITLEVRTKYHDPRALWPAAAERNVLLTWTLTPARFARAFEHGAPDTSARIRALGRAARRGARVGVRLDPVLPLPGWQRATEEMLEELARTQTPIEDIHIGVFRLPQRGLAALRALPSARRLLALEMVRTPDGMVRLFRPLREKVLGEALEIVRRIFGEGFPVRLCMEPSWMENRLGIPPSRRDAEGRAAKAADGGSSCP